MSNPRVIIHDHRRKGRDARAPAPTQSVEAMVQRSAAVKAADALLQGVHSAAGNLPSRVYTVSQDYSAAAAALEALADRARRCAALLKKL